MNMAKVDLGGLIEKAGYDGIADFHRRSKGTVAQETVRRAVTEGVYSTWTLFLILHALGLAKSKIKEVLVESGDDLLSRYLDTEESLLHPVEKAILLASRKIINLDHQALALMVANFKYQATNLHVDITEELAVMEKATETLPT
jgi:hypothetical protein